MELIYKFDGTSSSIEDACYSYTNALLQGNPAFSHQLEVIINNATQRDPFDRETVVVHLSFSDDGKSISVECEPKKSLNFSAIDGSKLIYKGSISLTLNSGIKVSEIWAESFDIDKCKPFFANMQKEIVDNLDIESTGLTAFVSTRSTRVINASGIEFGSTGQITESTSRKCNNAETLKEFVNTKYKDIINIVVPAYAGFQEEETYYSK